MIVDGVETWGTTTGEVTASKTAERTCTDKELEPLDHDDPDIIDMFLLRSPYSET